MATRSSRPPASSPWHLHPAEIAERLAPLIVLAVLEATRYAVDLLKFRREARHHMWSSKLWGVALFAGFFEVLVRGSSGFAASCVVYVGIVADLEGLAISIVLPRWRPMCRPSRMLFEIVARRRADSERDRIDICRMQYALAR